MKSGRSIDEIQVGQKASFSRTFCEADVALFETVTWDFNPFHTNELFAKKSIFSRRIVHGLLTASMVTHFGGNLFPGPGFLATEMHFKFLAPVYIGDTITAHAEITEVNRERKRVKFQMRCFNEEGKEVLQAEVTGIPTSIDIPIPSE